uniref:Putative LOC100902024 [Metaseiulus occidentalis] n=1 Tax=Lepeophtheirus salmonis TaxID=72036 RepID=A0A0K2UXS2_LEPSM
MPPHIKIRSLIAKNGGERVWDYDEENKVMICRLCNFKSQDSRKFGVERHVKSIIHKKKLELLSKNEIKDPSFRDDYHFVTDMTKMIATCNIPLHIVSQPRFIEFMEQYTNKVFPSRYAVNRSLEAQSDEVLTKIKEEIEGKDIFLALDETTDSQHRSMTAVLMGSLDDHLIGHPYLINLEDVSKSDSNTAMTNVAIRSINNVFGSDFVSHRLKVFITNGAEYYVQTVEDLRKHFPLMVHVTFISQGLHKIVALCPDIFSNTSTLISKLKKMFAVIRDLNVSKRSLLTDGCIRDLMILRLNSDFVKIEEC